MAHQMFPCLSTAEIISIAISIMALILSAISLWFSRKDKFYIANLFLKIEGEKVSAGLDKRGETKFVVQPHFVVRVVNQGQINIYPELIEITEKLTKETVSIKCQTFEYVESSGIIPRPVEIDEVVSPGKNKEYHLVFPDSLTNTNLPIESLRFQVKLTLENNRVFIIKNIPISKEYLELLKNNPKII